MIFKIENLSPEDQNRCRLFEKAAKLISRDASAFIIADKPNKLTEIYLRRAVTSLVAYVIGHPRNMEDPATKK